MFSQEHNTNRAMGKRGRGLSVKEVSDHLAELIRKADVCGTPISRVELISTVAKEQNTSKDVAEKALEVLIQSHKVIEIASENSSRTVLHDLLRFKMRRERRLRVGPNDVQHLFSVVRATLLEKAAKSSQYAMSISEINDYVQLTYVLEGNSDEHLYKGIMKTLTEMLKKDLVEEKVPLNNESKYFATASLILTSSLTSNEPSTSSAIDVIVPHDSIPSSSSPSPNSTSSKRREKRLSDTSIQNSVTSKSELKSLQDSLSSFFTPSNSRRSRVAQSSFSFENLHPLEGNKLLGLEIDVDIKDEPPRKKGPLSKTSMEPTSPGSSNPLSPSRQADKLTDSLSPYFSANSERRRKHEKGEYLQLCNGVPLKRKGNLDLKGNLLEMDDQEEGLSEEDLVEENSTQSELLEEDPAAMKRSRRISGSLPARTSTDSLQKNKIKRTGANLIKKYNKSQTPKKLTNGTISSSPSVSSSTSTALEQDQSSSALNGLLNPFGKASTSADNTVITLDSPSRSISISPVKRKNSASTSEASLLKVSQKDEDLFFKAQQKVRSRIEENTKWMRAQGDNGVFPPKIRIGKFEIQSLYSSPYPEEFAALPLLYICEKCLMYMCNDARHQMKCRMKYPPGNEIYRKDNISIFEVDGNTARVYCRNLCLLAKLFMDHKTLYFDVEPFLFYVCTVTDQFGTHFVGYFSKEKFSHQQFNLACIVTLPAYQNSGYGRFLIDFSYLLSRRESMIGTPERPLSTLGSIAYNSYWRGAIFEYLYRRKQRGTLQSLSVNEIARQTGISGPDLTEMMSSEGLLQDVESQVCLTINWDRINAHYTKALNDKRRIWLDEDRLIWVPRVYTPIDMRTPLTSPSRHDSTQKMDISSPMKHHVEGSHRHLFGSQSSEESQRQQKKLVRTPNADEKKKQNRKNCETTVLTPRHNQQQAEAAQEAELLAETKHRRFSSTRRRERSNAASASGSLLSHQKPSHANPEDYINKRLVSTSESDDDSDAYNPPGRRPKSSKQRRSGKAMVNAKKVESDSEPQTDWGEQRPGSRNSSVSMLSEDFKEIEEKKNKPIKEEEKLPEQKRQSVAAKKGKGGGKQRGKPGRKGKKNGNLSISEAEDDSTYVCGRSGKKPPGKKVTRGGKPAARTNGKKLPKPEVSTEEPLVAAESCASTPVPSPRPGTSRQAQYLPHETDEDDGNRSDLSLSPTPLGDRRHRLSTISCVNQETMNMGGEPDTVNMGGEPDDDDEHQQFAMQTTPKAPKPHLIEDEYSNQDIPPNIPMPEVNEPVFQNMAPPVEQEPPVQQHSFEWPVQESAQTSFNSIYEQPQSSFNQLPGVSNNAMYSTAEPPVDTSNSFDMSVRSHSLVEHRKSWAEESRPEAMEEAEMPILKAEASMPILVDETACDDEDDGQDAPPPLLCAQSDEAVPAELSSNGPVSESLPSLITSEPQIASSSRFEVANNTSVDTSINVGPTNGLPSLTHQNDFSQSASVPPVLHHQQSSGLLHQSPQLTAKNPTSSPANYKPSSHPQTVNMFSPPAPNSQPPMSQGSINNTEIARTPGVISPPNIAKPEVMHPAFNQQPQAYSPTKSRPKEKPSQSSQSRRRNTTDNSNIQKPPRPPALDIPQPQLNPLMNSGDLNLNLQYNNQLYSQMYSMPPMYPYGGVPAINPYTQNNSYQWYNMAGNPPVDPSLAGKSNQAPSIPLWTPGYTNTFPHPNVMTPQSAPVPQNFFLPNTALANAATYPHHNGFG